MDIDTTTHRTHRQIGSYVQSAPQPGREHVLERWLGPEGDMYEIEHNAKSTYYPYVVNAFWHERSCYGWLHAKTLVEARRLITGK